jgi:hypothetical protein
MATQERDELLRLVQELPEEAVHDLLILARDRSGSNTRPSGDAMSWIGCLHEGPDFAANYKEILRAEWGARE